jgi:hypothetical protein
METSPLPREYEQLQEILTESASKNDNPPPMKSAFTRQQQIAAINKKERAFQPPITAIWQPFRFRNPEMSGWSPLQLFLWLLAPVLDILLFHTNAMGQRQETNWKPLTMLGLRQWLAVRLEMGMELSKNATIASFWSHERLTTHLLSRDRFMAIERYLSLNSEAQDINDDTQWFWKVENAINLFRTQLCQFALPASHLTVDESTIKFFGRSSHKVLIRHKPAKEGFLIYTCCSYEGLVHNFTLFSSQASLEYHTNGITIDLPTRTTGERKKGHTGAIATQIHLPQLKAVVYTLCESVTRDCRSSQFVCFTDNLFTDPHLARALLTINIGICGTVRANAPAVPPILKAIAAETKTCLQDNQAIHRTIDNLVNIIVWRDGIRQHTVTFASTCFSPLTLSLAQRRTRYTTSIPHRSGFKRIVAEQPHTAVQYNAHMGHVDTYNHLRVNYSCRRSGQLKWTKKWLEFMIDTAHTNAFLAWKSTRPKIDTGHRQRRKFLSQLIPALIEMKEYIHKPCRREKRGYCAMVDCQATPRPQRRILGEVDGNARPLRAPRITDYCEKCLKYLCMGKGCWERHHRQQGYDYSLHGDGQEHMGADGVAT